MRCATGRCGAHSKSFVNEARQRRRSKLRWLVFGVIRRAGRLLGGRGRASAAERRSLRSGVRLRAGREGRRRERSRRGASCSGPAATRFRRFPPRLRCCGTRLLGVASGLGWSGRLQMRRCGGRFVARCRRGVSSGSRLASAAGRSRRSLALRGRIVWGAARRRFGSGLFGARFRS